MHAADMGFLPVNFEEKFPFHELCDACADPFGRPWTFAEDDAVIGITHERKSASFEFAGKFRQHYIAQYGAWRVALRHFPLGVLIFVPDYNTCFEILVYQRYDSAVLDCLSELLYQFTVVDYVKELFKVKLYVVFNVSSMNSK